MKPTFILSFLISFILCWSGCINKSNDCGEQAPHQRLSYELSKEIFFLNNISKYSFVANLNTLTFHNGYYYNIDKDKKAFYEFYISPKNQDTSEVVIQQNINLGFTPSDFYIDSNDLFILSNGHFPTLYKYASVFGNQRFDISKIKSSKNHELQDRINLLPNSKLHLIKNRFIVVSSETAARNDASSEFKYYSCYDLKEKKVTGRFTTIPEIYEKQNFPGVEMPFKLDLDSVSLVSFGSEHFISAYNNRTGDKIGSYCAKSSHIKIIEGIDRDELNDFQQAIDYVIGQAYYLDIIHDKKHNCIYRIAKHKQSTKKESSMKLNKAKDSPLSLVVLDIGLNFLDEIVFPPHIINYYKHFSDDDGLHFLATDTSNQDESRIEFKLLKIK